MASWFSSQWHAIDASVQTIDGLNELLRDSEEAMQLSDGQRGHNALLTSSRKNFIDAVVVSHEFTDHCHKQTLLEVDPTTPVFATDRAVNVIKSWNHFSIVLEISSYSSKNPKWHSSPILPLPTWIGISRVVNDSDALHYHSAILISFDVNSCDRRGSHDCHTPAEAVMYTPHGIHAQDLHCLTFAWPPLKVLALLHGLHDIRISLKRLNLGAHNGLQAQRICNAKYWISTHDEVKNASGIISSVLNRKVLTLNEALVEERRRRGFEKFGQSQSASTKSMIFADLLSGESLLLL